MGILSLLLSSRSITSKLNLLFTVVTLTLSQISWLLEEEDEIDTRPICVFVQAKGMSLLLIEFESDRDGGSGVS